MKVLAIYAVNEHINQMMVDAQQARMAREASGRPSLARRIAGAARSTIVRTTPHGSAAAA